VYNPSLQDARHDLEVEPHNHHKKQLVCQYYIYCIQMEEDILDAFLSYAVFHDDELEAPDTKPRKQSRRPSKKSKTAQPQHDDDDSFAKATCEAMLQGAGKLADARRAVRKRAEEVVVEGDNGCSCQYGDAESGDDSSDDAEYLDAQDWACSDDDMSQRVLTPEEVDRRIMEDLEQSYADGETTIHQRLQTKQCGLRHSVALRNMLCMLLQSTVMTSLRRILSRTTRSSSTRICYRRGRTSLGLLQGSSPLLRHTAGSASKQWPTPSGAPHAIPVVLCCAQTVTGSATAQPTSTAGSTSCRATQSHWGTARSLWARTSMA
jgi:hypothetical protein